MSSHSSTALHGLLRAATVDELISKAVAGSYVVHEPVVCVQTSDTVGLALRHMAEHKISAVPVFHAASSSFVGFVDRLDLVAYILDKLSGNDSPTAEQIDSVASAAAEQEVGTVVDFSRWDPVVVVKAGTPLFDLVAQFAKGIHRAAVVDANDTTRILGVATQSAFLRWLVPRLNSAGDGVNKSLRDLGQLGFGPVLSVREDESALLALKRIGLFRVSAAAVLNDKDEVVESFSGTDLNGLTLEPLSSLLLPVREFLRPVRRRHMPVSVTGPITSDGDATLAEVATLLSTCSVHRVWLVDAQRKPIGVVSITDVADAVVSRC